MEGHFEPQAEQIRAVRDGTLDATVKAHLDRLLAADLLVLSFPLWWFSLPAVLKWWVDRVFVMGAVFGGDHGLFDDAALADRRVMLLFTTGGLSESFRPGGAFGPMDDFLAMVESVRAWWNRCPISVLSLTRVQVWSGQPCATGPLASSCSRTGNSASFSLGRAADPLECSACQPLSCQARRHRYTERTLTRRCFATTALPCPAANIPAAYIRMRSRNARRSAVRPPPCGYLMIRTYCDGHRMSALHDITPINSVTQVGALPVYGTHGTVWLCRIVSSTSYADARARLMRCASLA
ncbi:NAD(P)H-dependent oxidoreductase [Streptomyces sp. GD-15H]|uniref:NAD(P)H-dependent oxidoreductase n=1 Tax=Streptomyces sp. GD-15H TaxID=3129112 RepID=UPI00324D883C